MIITISGVPGSGKSTVAGIVAQRMKFRHVSIGDIMREIAASRGMTLLEVSKLAEKDKSIDVELDNRQKELSKKDKLVIDSRLGFHFIPHSFKVFLYVSPEEAGKRIFAARSNAERKSEKENITLKKTIENISRRKQSERLRYKKFYGVNPFDKGHYDLVIDTTKLAPSDVADRIVAGLRGKGSVIL